MVASPPSRDTTNRSPTAAFFAPLSGLESQQPKPLEKLSFLEMAVQFKEGNMTIESSLDYHLMRLGCIPHETDREKGQMALTVQLRSSLVCILNGDLVAGAINNTIGQPGFRQMKDLRPFKALIMSAWHGDLIAIQEATSAQESESYFQLPLLEIFIAAAFVRSHLDLLSYLVKLTSPPSTSIFDKIYSIWYGRESEWRGHLDNAACWLIVLDAGWIHRPFPTEELIYHGIRSNDNQSAISFLQRIDAVSIESFPIKSLFEEATFDVVKWVVSQLLALGKKIDSKAIHSAIMRAGDAPAAIKILLEAGVDVNARSLTLLSCKDWFILGEETGPSGETALIAACRYGKRESVEALLRGGARRDLKDDYGKSAWDRAKEAGRSDIVELLDKY